MVIMEHPNGCVHNVRDESVSKFLNAGWTIKGEETPLDAPEEPKKRKTTKSKK